MNKQMFLARVQAAWRELEAALAMVDEAQMEQPGPGGVMTVKDIIAHVTWFEREMVQLVQRRVLNGSELWELPGDERNAVILAQYRDRPLAQVRAEAQTVHRHLLAALAELDEAALNDPHHFQNMPPEWVPWRLLAENTLDHYTDHARDLRSWLAWNGSGETLSAARA